MEEPEDSAPLKTPDPEILAFWVKMQRGRWRWKQPTLASMAGVSLSTVQRVERGEIVSADALSKISVALGCSADYLTAPRRKLSEEEALKSLIDSMSWMEGKVEVPVAPLSKEKQIRELVATHMVVLHHDLDDDAADDLDGLREWLDFLSFMRCHQEGLIQTKADRGFRMREAYQGVFDHLKQMQSRHKAVCLVGTYEAETDSSLFPTSPVAVIWLRSKIRNPAAAKLTSVWCEAKVSWKDAMEHLP